MRATTEDDDDTHSPKSHIESRPYIPVGSFVIKWNKVAMIMSGFMKLKYFTLVGHMVERSVVTCSLGRACTRGAVSRGLKRMAHEKGIINKEEVGHQLLKWTNGGGGGGGSGGSVGELHMAV